MILVLGAGGLLGSWICFRYPKDTIGLTHKDLDVTDGNALLQKIEDISPEAIINCVGITERHPEQFMMGHINATFPHRLASMCDLIGAKLVNISTDCVFSGNRGQYTEEDTPDATNEYGKTKHKGEIYYTPHLTIRSSFVGSPDPTGRGLLAWLEGNRGKDVQGYTKARWNGLCVPMLADILVDLSYRHIHGLLHIYGESISKCDLLVYAKYVYDLDVNILPTDEPIIDRTLSTVRRTPVQPIVGIYEQLMEMKKWETQYREYLLSYQ